MRETRGGYVNETRIGTDWGRAIEPFSWLSREDHIPHQPDYLSLTLSIYLMLSSDLPGMRMPTHRYTRMHVHMNIHMNMHESYT